MEIAVVESPTGAKTVSRDFGDGYRAVATTRETGTPGRRRGRVSFHRVRA